jgi:preprotein translocase subunit SecB
MTDQPIAAAGDGNLRAQASIERIYVKDLSLENPGAPQSFQDDRYIADRNHLHARRQIARRLSVC